LSQGCIGGLLHAGPPEGKINLEYRKREYKFEGGGWELVNKELIMTWMLLFLLMVIVPGVVAFRGCVRMDVELELNTFN
jgi:hypothetical protein